MSMKSLARALIRASQRFGKVEELSPSETTALLEAELIKAATVNSRWPRYKLTKLGWDLARRLSREPQPLPSRGPHADPMADR